MLAYALVTPLRQRVTCLGLGRASLRPCACFCLLVTLSGDQGSQLSQPGVPRVQGWALIGGSVGSTESRLGLFSDGGACMVLVFVLTGSSGTWNPAPISEATGWLKFHHWGPCVWYQSHIQGPGIASLCWLPGPVSPAWLGECCGCGVGDCGAWVSCAASCSSASRQPRAACGASAGVGQN